MWLSYPDRLGKRLGSKGDSHDQVRVTPQRGMGFDKVAERIYNYPEVNSVYLISGGFDFYGDTGRKDPARGFPSLYPISYPHWILFSVPRPTLF